MIRVKIRRISKWNTIIAAGVGVLFLIISFWSNKEFQALQEATEKYILCEKAAKDLQDGSEYLTEQVRLYAMTGEQRYLDNYFVEANETCRREKALDSLKEDFEGTPAFTALESALESSQKLMDIEYYSMGLVLEAQGADRSTWPEELREIEISTEDQKLSVRGKEWRAQLLLSGRAYQSALDKINSQVTECMNDLIETTRNEQGRASSIFSDMYRKLEVGLLIMMVMMLVMSLIVRKLVVVPLIKCGECIEQGKTFPLMGAVELQALADTYNKVFKENQEAQMLIRHKAEHDPLTDLLNRGSFDKILDLYEKGEAPFALIIVDVDSFKTVNDTYGHAEGDEILKKVSGLLRTAFRSIDYVCRIGGDEFAVIMVEMTSDLKYTIQEKIDAVNETLKQSDDDLPKVSLSVGVAFSDRKNPSGTIFEDADKALYVRKSNGKAGCDFYEA